MIISRLEQAKSILTAVYSYASSPINAVIILALTLIICLAPLWLRETRWRS